MDRGGHNQGRGRGGKQGTPSRGRGRGGRGQGRGFRGRARGRGGGLGSSQEFLEAIDFSVLQNHVGADSNRVGESGVWTPRGRGRGRGGPGFESGRGRGTDSPIPRGYRGRGIGSPRGVESSSGRGRGRGYNSSRGGSGFGARFNPAAPLSQLLIEERPFLRPIKFVRASLQPTLFQEEEDLLRPVVEEVVDDEETSHVPTADRVTRIFSGIDIPRFEVDDEDEDDGLQQIDFADLGKFAEQLSTAEPHVGPSEMEVVEEKFTGILLNNRIIQGATATLPDALSLQDVIPETVLNDHEGSVDQLPEDPPLFFVDTAATAVPDVLQASGTGALDSFHAKPTRTIPDEDDEIIVYVAPHPRKSNMQRSLPPTPPARTPSPLPLASTSAVTGAVLFASQVKPKTPRRQAPAFTAHGRNKAQLKTRGLTRRAQKRARAGRSFGLFGARAEEARLQDEDERWEERRRGDSDLDWGDSDGEGDAEDHGMLVDPEIELDVAAMRSFASGMNGEWKTIEDLAIEQRMQDEDDEEGGAGNSSDDGDAGSEGDADSEDGDLDAAMDAEEDLMLGESDDPEEDSSEDDDFDQSPRAGFQARLERVRKAAQSRQVDDSLELMDDIDFDEEDDLQGHFTDANWAELEDILESTGRRGRKKLLSAMVSGDLVDLDEFYLPAKRGKQKRQDIPHELQEQWDRDRGKKAEYKRNRELARLAAAADPLSAKKGGKKGRKAMKAAARLDPTITVLPNRVIDMSSLEQQIRRFIGNIGGPQSMTLPPCDKATRKSVHEMAMAFGLSSVSKGKGDSRYTTLTKTTRTGLVVNEKKIGRIVRQGGSRGQEFVQSARGRAPVMPKHRDGDEVGKAAPKISQSNVGFKLLAMMGWAEGERIGAGKDGLHAPLTAVIKNTKLGLGATR
ncbi:unnamed protein product [Mycena citricolor]|uniref:Protein SQS1 n=1 Tax=Mycena citricolor TaxID=2018698 RepID=A0AAD2K2E1_9AGAR|nr:unnamed protein product [Mycena citricolor]